jgi:predicted lipid-binding transport protein (Tim44 family)
VERLVVSRSNSKRMARLAELLADQLDPAGEGQPAAEKRQNIPDAQEFPAWRSAYLLGGLAAGATIGWAAAGAQGVWVMLLLGAVIVLAVLVTMYRDWREG